MATIGAQSFFNGEGPPPKLAGVIVESITRMGVGGEAFWQAYLLGEPYVIRTLTRCTSANAIGAAVDTYRGLQASMVTYTDDLGVSWLNQMVLDVRPLEGRRIIGASDGVTTHVLFCDWTLKHVQV